MTLDNKGREISLPTETIKQVKYNPEQQNIVPVVIGYVSEPDRHVHTEAESANVSQSIKEAKPKGSKAK